MRRKASQAFLNASHRKKFENHWLKSMDPYATAQQKYSNVLWFTGLSSNLINVRLDIVKFSCQLYFVVVSLFYD